jgi:hypothetical protein
MGVEVHHRCRRCCSEYAQKQGEKRHGLTSLLIGMEKVWAKVSAIM